MDVCMDRRCLSGLARTPTEIKIKSCYPLITRRPSTSYTSRQAFSPSPRIQSAYPRLTMAATPRANVVSTAGFYDWSTEDVGEASMTNIYRKLAVNQKNRTNRGTKHWCADGVHLNPGRMFIRDKADLTKGEREIIAGIYKNRGDVHKEGGKNGVVTHIKSHSDAWLVGKPLNKKATSGEIEKCSIKIPDSVFSKTDTPREAVDTCEPPNYMCEKCKEHSMHHRYETEAKLLRGQRAGRTAPPSTPSESPKTPRKQKSTPRVVPEGGVFVEAGKTFIDPEEGSKKKKVFVDVFLPKFPTQSEMTNVSIQLEKDNDKPEKRKDSASRKSQFELLQEETDNYAPEDKLRNSGNQRAQNSRVCPAKSERSRKPRSLSSSRSNSSAGE